MHRHHRLHHRRRLPGHPTPPHPTPPRPAPPRPAPPPQQRQISQLAAAGHTYKEIPARVFLSPRSVAAHLYRVFPKLGSASLRARRESTCCFA
ncbi:LuxR C-terminal-related transcriptional regulator [Streptomyces sp. NPDC101776]|uniref:LuxR C-terminal-related transcriptional regulator n=1 Tax=Streptomyces sp. NPDC101776 TaxID=3366146 RepID=UPI00382F99C7